MKYRITLVYEFDAPSNAIGHLESMLEALEEADFDNPTSTLIERHDGWVEIQLRER